MSADEQAKSKASESEQQVQKQTKEASEQVVQQVKKQTKEASEQVQLAKIAASDAVQKAAHVVETAAHSAHKASSFSVVHTAGVASDAVQQATGATSGAARAASEAMQQVTGATSHAARQAVQASIQAVSVVSDTAQNAVCSASVMALSAGSQAHKSTSEVVTNLFSKDPQDIRATVVCSELMGPLVILPGKGRLNVVDAWYGHLNNPTHKLYIRDEAQACITYEEKGYGLELPTFRRFWSVDTNEPYLYFLSVTYEREVTDEPTPGEVLRMQCAREAVKNAEMRARYELLKQIVGSLKMGSWISTTPILMGMPVPGKTVHAIYVSNTEVVSWSVEEGLRSMTYLSFLHENGTTEIQIQHRPPNVKTAQKIADYVRSLVDVKMPCVNGRGQPMFKDSKAFCTHCYGAAASSDCGTLKAAGTFGAAIAVAAHVDEAAAAVTLPVAGVSTAAAVGFIGATVVSPLALGGLWYLQRRNDARLGLAIVNQASMPVSVSAFELGDAKCAEWGPLRSSCTSIGGRASGTLAVGQLLELNPPSSSNMFQLRYAIHNETAEDDGATSQGTSRYKYVEVEPSVFKKQKGSKDGTNVKKAKGTKGRKKAEDAKGGNDKVMQKIPEVAEKLIVEPGDDALSCVFVERGYVYHITQQAGALMVSEVPEHFIPAYAQNPMEKFAKSLPVHDEMCLADAETQIVIE
jgi:hypothetical protein